VSSPGADARARFPWHVTQMDVRPQVAPPGAALGPWNAPTGASPAGGTRTPQAPTSEGTSRRIPGLDGLRALAVAAVVIYHLGAGWLPGGFLGVDLFFVISGFLITTLLLGEIESRGRVRYGQFYLRRARRLLPALFLVLAACLVLSATVARDVAHSTIRDVPGALAYVSNWWMLGQEQSYFDLIGRGNLLGHLWSLAVEEQFYLIWPLLLGALALLASWIGRPVRRVVLVAALVGAVASTAWMATLAFGLGIPLQADPTRVYVGTDAHAMSVLVGAALATVWNVRRFRTALAPGARAVLVAAGTVGLVLAGLLAVGVSEYSPWLYRGGFLLAAGVFALVVAAATHPGSPLGPALDNPPMRWIGQRSYGIYLWHWPIFLVTRPGIDVPWVGPGVEAARVGLVVLVAAASYRFVEVPVRRGDLGRWWRARRDAGLGLAPATRRGALALGGAVLAVVATAGLLATAPSAQEVAAAQAQGGTTDVVDSAAREAPVVPTAGLTSADISWYGDSVTRWAVEALRRDLPAVRIDAGLNRSPGFIMNRATTDAAAGRAGRVVVMHLGNAGPISERALRDALTTLADRDRVVLVNSTARFAYVQPNNAVLARVAAGQPNVVVVDWRALSAGHPEWFTDGLHLTEAGKAEFAAAVHRAALGDQA